ncbi:HupE/UreJ family protein [Runella salmonicolor]|uniref:HupE/UreJ family protein n=1 Tax=Runella salmonicolor TaxID=2950278 RepID=A0ABT1FRD4_9BACT|nr:HupE/UreJ family protein [Runella salmonicolor]MCP1384266.1 HupE/UreJ family protein [Runella salmonicolor]
MSEFQAYLQLGFSHITDPNGYDHILFVIALCAIYAFKEWKKVLVLVTAFTLGHSVTLALATLKMITYSSAFIELLIPITIFITAVSNFSEKSTGEPKSPKLRYVLAACFGLIHGMGFSNYLRSLLGDQDSIVMPLFAFNVGLELGQLVIVAIALAIASLFVEVIRVKRLTWNHLISGIVAGMALSLILENEVFRTFIGLSVE